ncbi:ABC transporter permease [bacterium]|nr:MAG: ABC transporter permease [bacterium]
MKRLLANKETGLTIILIVLSLVVWKMNPQFVSGTNLRNLAQLVGMYGIFSIGLGIIIITSGIDLSVGSVFALLGVLLAMALTEWKWPPVLAIVAALGFTSFLGFLHGVLITRVKLQPFIVTLCGLLIYRGLARFVAKDETKGFGTAEGFEWLKSVATGDLFGIPTPFIVMLAVAVLTAILLHRSVYGRHLYATGRNEEASRYSGINTKRVVTLAYVFGGLLAGVSGILIAFYTNSVSPSSHGNSYELYGIAAAVLGGCSLRGGEGSVYGVVIGTILLQVLQNLVNLLGIPTSLNFAVMGAVILIGVVVDRFIGRKA